MSTIECFVVMGNDYPAAVFISESAAEEYILYRKWDELTKRDYQKTHIHWRHYEFPLLAEWIPETLHVGSGKSFKNMTTEELRYEWFYWFRREDGKSGAAASAANELRRSIETELGLRDINVGQALLVPYRELVRDQRRRVSVGSKSSGANPDK